MGLREQLSNAARKLVKRFTDSAEKGTESRNGPTQEGAEYADRQLHEGTAEAKQTYGQEAGRAARDGTINASTIRHQSQWLWNGFKKILEKAADKVGGWFQKTFFGKAVAVSAGTIGGLLALSAAVEYGLLEDNATAPPPLPPPAPYVVDLDIPPPLPSDIREAPFEFATFEDDFSLAASQFDGGSLLDRLRIERFELETADLPKPIVLYPAARATVSVTENNSTQTVETSVGQLYEDWPDAQPHIENAVTQNRGADIRVDITIRSEVADISISNID